MSWFWLALTAAFSVALGDALNKKFFSREGMVLMAVARTLGPLPFLVAFLLATFSPAEFLHRTLLAFGNPDFVRTVALLLPLETLAILLYMEAIRISPLSLTLPLLSFTPAFIILTGYVVLGERLSWAGIGGILLVVAGSYLLNLPAVSEGPLAPFRALVRERGSLLMFGVALIYAVTSVLGKRAVLLSDPLWFAGTYFVILGLFVPAVLAILKRPPLLSFLRENAKGVLLLGLTQALMVVAHMKAISLAPAAYMIAVKRTSILFGVLLGGAFFRESHLRLRLFAALVMVSGVFLLALTQK
ncbi:DMT family transporter [Thermosulfurimonas sp. F29]|uniref:DMT family transporter n=1 Tax=Thermosulfurimonas sp. F29 TaxID=2867247 RepID=UPI001C839936|nr:DMT family transporter [Thermosulfurimonas sp. F29]MBX6423773.1 DMT family transporter [Thermosulfurimonas sp. F29]